jgi:hypothetical protein
MWRAVAVFRLPAFFYAVAVAVADRDHFTRPGLAYALLGVDIWLAAVLVRSTLAVVSHARVEAGAATPCWR